MAAPPGAARIIQLALAQVGKPYVWGAKGPEQFDCSGLVAWLYAQIGIRVPLGTAGQWPQMKPVTAVDLQPGDLVFLDICVIFGCMILFVVPTAVCTQDSTLRDAVLRAKPSAISPIQLQ
jgi:NlpC/P60 family protein